MRNTLAFAAIALLAAAPALAQQQDTEPEQPPVKKREVFKAVETHEEEAFKAPQIDGDWVKPSGRVIQGRGDAKFESIIEERAHFKRDLAKSIGVSAKTK